MKNAKAFSVGDKVFAKVKGYPAWPAKVSFHIFQYVSYKSNHNITNVTGCSRKIEKI